MLGLPSIQGIAFWEQLGAPGRGIFRGRYHIESDTDSLCFCAQYALRLRTWIKRFSWLEPPPKRSPQFEKYLLSRVGPIICVRE
eukprot:13648125-Alexandrium_andersonii.AAC.1